MAHQPTYTSVVSNHGLFRSACQASQQYIFDRPIKTLFDFANVTTDTAASEIKSHGTGTPELLQISTSEICGIYLDADNESYGHLWILPADIDNDKAIDFRLLWSEGTAGVQGSDQFVIVYTPLTAGTTAMAVGATVLDTVITDQADLAANIPQWTSWGSIAAGTTAVAALTPGDDALALKIYVDITTAVPSLIKGQVRYYRKYYN